MDNIEKEVKRIKQTNYVIFGLFVALLLGVIAIGVTYHYRHTFSTERWLRLPEERTKIVDDLLEDRSLVGMTEDEIVALLGEHNNDYGYFVEKNRYVYYLGPERGLISIDSEWLLLDFADGIVADYYIRTD